MDIRTETNSKVVTAFQAPHLNSLNPYPSLPGPVRDKPFGPRPQLGDHRNAPLLLLPLMEVSDDHDCGVQNTAMRVSRESGL
jgi:hypothetical protein